MKDFMLSLGYFCLEILRVIVKGILIVVYDVGCFIGGIYLCIVNLVSGMVVISLFISEETQKLILGDSFIHACCGLGILGLAYLIAKYVPLYIISFVGVLRESI